MAFQADKVIAVRTKKILYRDGDTVIKVFDKNYLKSSVLNEALNHARMEETGLPVPKLLDVLKVEDKWAIQTEYISGKTLEQKMEEQPEKKDEYLNLFLNLQMEVHAKTSPLLNKLKDKLDRQISQSKLDAAARYELHTRLEAMPKHNKVCHGDFNPSNILINEAGQPYILDWAHVAQGNASADAARTYLLFCLAGKKPLAEEYLEGFCQKSGTEKRYVQNWMPIVAAAQSVKANADECELLLKWADVVDYE